MFKLKKVSLTFAIAPNIILYNVKVLIYIYLSKNGCYYII